MKLFTYARLEVVSYSLVLVPTLFNCASTPLGHSPAGNFLLRRINLLFYEAKHPNTALEDPVRFLPDHLAAPR